MHKQKTLSEYQEELAKLEKALATPGLDDLERKIYTDTIDRIKTQMQMVSANEAPTKQAKPNKPPARPHSERTTEAPNIPTTQIKAGVTPLRMSVFSEKDEAPVISVQLSGAIKNVTIKWNSDKSDTLTEGETRSRFTTALRDLSESRLVKQDRYQDVPGYIVYQRAVAYYRALAEFWGEAPSAAQLNLTPMSRVRNTLFEMIAQSAQSITA